MSHQHIMDYFSNRMSKEIQFQLLQFRILLFNHFIVLCYKTITIIFVLTYATQQHLFSLSWYYSYRNKTKTQISHIAEKSLLHALPCLTVLRHPSLPHILCKHLQSSTDMSVTINKITKNHINVNKIIICTHKTKQKCNFLNL